FVLGVDAATGEAYWGFDSDGSRDPESGELSAAGREYLEHVPGYAEVSPSGTGFKVFGTGELPAGLAGRENSKLDGEPCHAGRYFAITGKPLADRAALTPVSPKALDAFRAWFPAATSAEKPRAKTAATSSTGSTATSSTGTTGGEVDAVRVKAVIAKLLD